MRQDFIVRRGGWTLRFSLPKMPNYRGKRRRAPCAAAAVVRDAATIHHSEYAIAYVDLVDEKVGSAAITLRAARRQAGLTQAALGERAGVSQALISAYENGRRQPTLPTLARLVRAAGFDVRVELAPVALTLRAPREDGRDQ